MRPQGGQQPQMSLLDPITRMSSLHSILNQVVVVLSTQSFIEFYRQDLTFVFIFSFPVYQVFPSQEKR
jgi:hypothetical protein